MSWNQTPVEFKPWSWEHESLGHQDASFLLWSSSAVSSVFNFLPSSWYEVGSMNHITTSVLPFYCEALMLSALCIQFPIIQTYAYLLSTVELLYFQLYVFLFPFGAMAFSHPLSLLLE